MVDQFGYLPGQQKIAVLRDPVTGFDNTEAFEPGATLRVVNTANNAVAFTGSATAWNGGATDASSGDRAWLFDFSSVTAAGSYEILDVDRNVRSARFDIGANVYRPVLVQAVRTFFYQRAGHAKATPFAGAGWVDAASHLGPLQDANARRYDAAQDASTERDLRGGWYDAGDYKKYTSWTSEYIVGLLHAYTENPGIWTDDFNIPESGNGVPDLLDEVKWGVDHLVRLQNDDGSVLSIVGMAHASPPSSATGPSVYGRASTSATLSAAAAYAQAARVFGALNTPAFNTYTAGLRTRAQEAAYRGYAVSSSEWDEGLTAVAVPITSRSSRVIASLSLSGPSHRFPYEAVERFAADLSEAAGLISDHGFSHPLGPNR